MKNKTDIIIVGSGIGGATVAKELVKTGKKILILEKGQPFSLREIGSELQACKFYDKSGFWSRSKEGIYCYRAIMLGGTSVISCGNGVRSLEKEFKKIGIDLTKEFIEVEKELSITSVPYKFIGPGTAAIMKSAERLGFGMKPMPKFINFKKCISCGNCVLGCRTDAKWTALKYLKAAKGKNVSLLNDINVTRVLISRGRAIGIEGYGKKGEKIRISADIVILAAGGIGTPIILQNSGLRAGRQLFLDLFTVTVGVTKDVSLNNEVPMAAVNHQKGFVLSPFMDCVSALASTLVLRYLLRVMQKKHMLGIMVKIKDDSLGMIFKDGTIEKTITRNDLSKLKKGENIARKILIGAGADPKTIVTTKVRGAHPGGTAAIGEVVDKNLQTSVKGLFVCDASVLPQSPGLPPIVTIIALAKRFSRQLISNYKLK